MKKYTYTNTMPYTYDPAHRGAPYLIGDAYKNHGEFLESVAKYHRGLDYMVNPATSYDEGSDIESLNASVKSSKCSLAQVFGPDFDTILDTYMANVHSTLWIFMVDIGEEITEYHMSASEFYNFTCMFGYMTRASGSHLLKIRYKAVSGKMLKWLEEKVEA